MRAMLLSFLSMVVISGSVWAYDDSSETGKTLDWVAEQGELRLEVGGQDWREYETFCLPLWNAKRTAARIAVEILGAENKVLGQVVFAADWAGDNAMMLWLSNFQPVGDKTRFADVRAVRLQCREPGLWPTVLKVGPFRLLHQEPVWPVNESDVVIDMGWHDVMARPELWTVVEESSTVSPDELMVGKPWPWTEFSYIQGRQAGCLTVERKFDIDLKDYSQMLGKMMWDPQSVMTATAIVDGGREIILHHGPWQDGWLTFGHALDGAQHLDAVRLRIKETPGGDYTARKVTMALFYLLLRKPTALDDAPMNEVAVRLGPPYQIWPCSYYSNFPDQKYIRRKVPQVPFDKPVDSNTPIGDPLKESLPFGFMLRRQDLSELRKQATSPNTPAARVFAAIKDQADQAIATELVDRKIGNRLYGGGIGQLKGLMGAGMKVFGPQVAMTHLITGEEKYAVAARRWVLRVAQSDDWRGEATGNVIRPQIGDLLSYSDSFTGWYPKGFGGYMNHTYHMGDVAFGVAVSYDMLYHCFSPQERELVEKSFADKGIYILYDRLRRNREGYMKFNQGAWFATPLLMQAVILKDKDPVYQQMYEWTLSFLKDYGQLGPWSREGVLREGAGYGDFAMLMYIEAMMVMSACTETPVSELVTPSFVSAMEFLQHARSTAHEKPLTLSWSDNGGKNWVQGGVLAFFARHLKDPAAQYLWNESYASGQSEDVLSLALLAHRDIVEPQEPVLPPARAFWDEPVAFLRTGWKYGDTHLAITNIQQLVGHGHKDRASVILEYNGEDLLLDPGMVNYYNPLARQYQETFCHNTLTFSQQSQDNQGKFDTSFKALLSTSGPVCPGRKGGIDWLIADATAVYPQAVQFHRHVVFLRPDVFVLLDEVIAKKEETMELNFTCKGPVTGQENTFVSATGKNNLMIYSLATCPLKHRFSGWGTPKENVPSYRLIRSTESPVKECAFLTVLATRPASQRMPEIETKEVNGAVVVRVSLPESEYWIMWRQNQGDWSGMGVETDAKGVVVSRQGSDVTGMAMLRGSQLKVNNSEFVLKGNRSSLSGAVHVDGTWIVEQADISPAEASNRPTTDTSAKITLHKDIEYAKIGAYSLLLDIYTPESEKPLPLIIFVHGGGWAGMSKEDPVAVSTGFLEKGYAVASINYRLTDKAIFPAQIQDCKAAVRFLRAHSKKYNLDSKRFGVWGVSAGGHLASLLGTSNDNTSLEGDIGPYLEYSSTVDAVCSFCGPSDLTATTNAYLMSFIQKLLGGTVKENLDLAMKASPVHYIDSNSAPMLLVHGQDDDIVEIDQSKNFYELLKKAGVDASLIILPKTGHTTFIDVKTIASVESFFDKHLKN